MTRTGGPSPGEWFTVVNPEHPLIGLTNCAECGVSFKEGGKVQQIEGGYGYRCEQCGEKRSSGERGLGP